MKGSEAILNSKVLYSASLPLTILLCTVYLANFRGLLIYPTIYRVTYLENFQWLLTTMELGDSLLVAAMLSFGIGFYFSKARRLIFWAGVGTVIGFLVAVYPASLGYLVIILASIIASLLVLAYVTKWDNILNPLDMRIFLVGGIVMISVLELGSLVMWLAYPFNPQPIYSQQSWIVSLFEHKIFSIASLISPIFMILIVYWFLFTLNKKIFLRFISRLDSTIGKLPKLVLTPASKLGDLWQKESIFLLILVFASIMVPLYPLLPPIQLQGLNHGVDVPIYEAWVNAMTDEQNTNNVLQMAFSGLSGGDRPLPLLTMYVINTFCDCSFIRALPLIFSPITSVSIYFFAKKGLGMRLARYAAILTPVTFYTIVGIYGGFLANWFALPLLLAAMYSTIKFSESKGSSTLLVILGFSIALLFSHIYTWAFLTVSIFLFMIVRVISTYREERKFDRRFIIGLSLLLFANILLDNLRTSYLESVGGISSNFIVASDTLGPNQFTARWNNLSYTFRIYLGGLFSDPVLLGLAFVGILIMNPRKRFEQMIMCSVLILSFPILFGNTLSQARIMYIVPFQILAAVAISYIGTKSSGLWSLFLIVLILYYLNQSLRILSNLTFRSPA